MATLYFDALQVACVGDYWGTNGENLRLFCRVQIENIPAVCGLRFLTLDDVAVGVKRDIFVSVAEPPQYLRPNNSGQGIPQIIRH